MKEQLRPWLMALAVSLFVPAMLFSVAEKLVVRNVQQDSTGETNSIAQEETQHHTAEQMLIPVLQPSGSLVFMNLDAYLTGVLLGELPADFETEALKAQAVVARTYCLKRHTTGQKHPAGAICTESACCQAYCAPSDYLLQGGTQETVNRMHSAVRATVNEVLLYNGDLIEATYFSCSGGRTEDAQAVWGTDIPYLQAVDSPGEEHATHYAESVEFSTEEFCALLGIRPKGSANTWFGEVTYTDGGGVATMAIGEKRFRGTTLRQLLGLRSTAFTVMAVGDSIHIYTKGFGHRVGMSQYGAEAMAVKGSDYRQILSHYYPGATLDKYLVN